MIATVSRIILAPLCLCLPLLAGAQTATVNFATTFQTIRGFGGAESWMPQFPTAQWRGEPLCHLHAERAGRQRDVRIPLPAASI
jgi:hypothetical protein